MVAHEWFSVTGTRRMVLAWCFKCTLVVRWATIASVVVAASSATTFADEDHAEQAMKAMRFVKKYCVDCHGADEPEGERDLASFKLPLESVQQFITADEIIDQVTLKRMPPEDADQPADDERVAAVEALRTSITAAKDTLKSHRGRTVMRRLSNREYENTLAVLFDRRVNTLGLTADFPKDNTSQHMDNIGDSLITSGFLLDQYFQAANRLVEMRLGKPETKPQSWHFTKNFRQYEELSGSHKNVFNYEYLCLYEQPNTDTRQGGYGHIEDFLRGVPVSGLYEIQAHAQAMHRDTHYDPKIFRIDFSEPFRLAVVPGDVTKGHIHYPQAVEPVLGSALVPDDEPQWLKFTVWLDAGQTPRFIFPNGPYESRASVIEVNRRYKDEFKGKGYRAGVSRAHILRHGALPHIRIGEIKIYGPLPEPGGTNEERAVFGPSGFQQDQAVEQLAAFASKAYRRPLTAGDRKRVESMYKSRLATNATPRQAAIDTIKLILCSPSFLYLSEITPGDQKTLGAYDLASRLSYALWAGPPDQLLLDVAAAGTLLKRKELRKHVERMLSDERQSARFVNGFLDSWLNLRDIGNLPPPRQTNRDYYAENLPASMKQEARLFFRHLLDTNGPVTDFLDADYTFTDKRLAKLYGLPEQKTLRLEDGFRKVDLKDNAQRGGLLGMAGVLTVSANGVDTSPVTRGVWVSENILGIHPPPPPDEVPSIDANVSGARTIREKLAKHQADKTCAVCHRNIDPLGFALESFDPIGRWRKQYPKLKGKAAKIDASGKLPSGEPFNDFAEYKRVLKTTRSAVFTRNLISRLLAYSTGRHMERIDRLEIDEIQKRVQANDGGLRTMVTEVLTSEIFRSP